ncbi:unnamed protein product [Nezara viridula]|uniref:mannose-6-phosphate isomerase n=1 Tax=Nezara viridula TaxID=85310 RepID=A0A9P0MTY1_NEZVI|nr:unnamed protein product [Nezara viridula]
MELRGYVQSFETGQLGGASIVSTLHWTPKNKERKIDETSDKHYAELWIGTNPNGEAILRKTKEKLSKIITQHPHILGISSYLFEDKLPFLLKVLSIARPKSMMMHPNERLASILHNDNPSEYPDPMHKPVMVVALSDFEVMAGFRPKNEIMYFLKNIPELKELIEPKLLEDYFRTKKSYYLRKIVEYYMNTEEDKLTEVINKYFSRMETEDYITREDHILGLVEKIHKLFPYDLGVFMIFFLNHFTVEKDEAIYIRPLVPYSFLFGDAIECTTNSNNNIPITFTSGNKELSLFIEYGDFTSFEINQLKVEPRFEPYFTIYDCDEDEYVLSKLIIPKDQYYSICGRRTLCIFIIIKGTALTLEWTKIKVGTIILLPSSYTYHMRTIEELTIFMVEPNLVI